MYIVQKYLWSKDFEALELQKVPVGMKVQSK